jgi:hypothetical protein
MSGKMCDSEVRRGVTTPTIPVWVPDREQQLQPLLDAFGRLHRGHNHRHTARLQQRMEDDDDPLIVGSSILGDGWRLNRLFRLAHDTNGIRAN